MRKQVKEFYYTKASGDKSFRRLVVLREPQKLYLGLDVTDMPTEEVDALIEAIAEADKHRDLLFEKLGVGNRWRSFKPEGIEWVVE